MRGPSGARAQTTEDIPDRVNILSCYFHLLALQDRHFLAHMHILSVSMFVCAHQHRNGPASIAPQTPPQDHEAHRVNVRMSRVNGSMIRVVTDRAVQAVLHLLGSLEAFGSILESFEREGVRFKVVCTLGLGCCLD